MAALPEENIVSPGGSTLMRGLSMALSYLLHPILIPLYMVFLLLCADSAMWLYVSQPTFVWVFNMVMVNAVMVPVAAIIVMRLLGVIGDYSLSTRRDRIFPLFIVALCYGLCGWLLVGFPMLFIMQRFMSAAMACTVFALAVTLFWQISLHMIACGGVAGGLSLMLFAGNDRLLWPLCVVIVLSGLLGSARLYLGKHTPGQVAAGFFGGFFVTIFALLVSIV